MERLTDDLGHLICRCEDCGEPEELCPAYYDPCMAVEKALIKLRNYEDLEEQGLLLKLPCKVGTKVFYVQKCLAPSCKKCMGFTRVNNCYTEHKARIFEQEFFLRHLKAFGETVFLTKAEAEKALEEMEK